MMLWVNLIMDTMGALALGTEVRALRGSLGYLMMGRALREGRVLMGWGVDHLTPLNQPLPTP